MTDTTQSQPGRSPVDEPQGEVASSPLRLAAIVAIVLGFGVITRASWLVVVLALVVMIFLHELGHYLTAKWSGMKVTEFFIGFGPKLWSFQRGETEYGLKGIPAGAYVRIIGMNNLEEVPAEDEPRTYRQQSFPKRLLVVCAGSIMHFLQAFALLVLLFVLIGVPGEGALAQRLGGPAPDPDEWVIGSVVPGSAADVAGIQEGDDIVRIDGDSITEWNDVGDAITPHAGDTIEIDVRRDGQTVALEATIGENEKDPSRGFLGVGAGFPEMAPVRVGPIRGVSEAAAVTKDTMGQAMSALGSFFTSGISGFADQVANGGNDASAVAGGGGGSADGGSGRPVADGDEDRLLSIYGAARIGVDLTDRGIGELMLFLVSINIFIGIFNLVPLLPLDGGHAAIAIYERVRSIGGRRYMADVSRLLPLTYAFVMLMLLLGVSSLYLDIVDPIGVG